MYNVRAISKQVNALDNFQIVAKSMKKITEVGAADGFSRVLWEGLTKKWLLS